MKNGLPLNLKLSRLLSKLKTVFYLITESLVKILKYFAAKYGYI